MRLLTFILLLCPFLAFTQSAPLYGTAVGYVNGTPTFTPNTAQKGSELCVSINNKMLYLWNRDSSEWKPLGGITVSFGVPSTAPAAAGGTRTAINMQTGLIYWWNGTVWKEIIAYSVELAGTNLIDSLSRSGWVSTADLADGAVTWVKLAQAVKDSITAAGGTATGAAGGDLTGTYPNPLIGNDKVISANVLDGTLVNGDLASQTIDSNKVKNRAIPLLKIAPSGATNGQVPTFNSTSGNWEPGTVSGGGSGIGLKHVFSNSQPSDTSVQWVDTRYNIQQSYPIRTYANGAWTDTTDNARYYDFIGKTISYGKPIAILFSGQSNAAASLYFPSSDTGYYGDTITRKNIAYWNGSAWRVYIFASRAGVFSSTVGTNQIIELAQQISAEGRAVRLVGTREPGLTMVTWESAGASWANLIAAANASTIKQFSAFVWIHGEAELGGGSGFSTYKESWTDFITRLRAQTWMSQGETKILFPNHAISPTVTDYVATNAAGTAKGLDADTDPLTGWVAIPFTKESQFGGPDAFHFTTRDHERIGKSLYQTYKKLPYLAGNQNQAGYYSTYASNGINRWQILALPKSDSISMYYGGTGSNTGYVETGYAFQNNQVYSIKHVVKPEGSFGRGLVEWWLNSTGVNATISDLIARMSIAGTYFPKPTQTLTNAGFTTGTANSGTAALSFYADGSVAANPTIGKAVIAASATGSSGQSDLHVVMSPSGGATPVIGTNTVAIFKQTGRVGIGTITPSHRLDVQGSFGTKVSTITSSTELDETQHTILVSGASGAVDITLPQAGFYIGREYTIICTNLTNPVNVIRRAASSDFICLPNGTTNATSVAFQKTYQTLQFKCTANNQWVLVDNLNARYTGTGTPEGVFTAPVGATFQRTDGGSGTTFYVKESGTGNTGWIGYSGTATGAAGGDLTGTYPNPTVGANKIVTSYVLDGTLLNADLASQTVDSNKIKNRVITTVKLEDNAVTASKVASQTLDSADIKNRGVTLLKLAASGATNGQFPKFNSTSGNWESGAVTQVFTEEYNTITSTSSPVTLSSTQADNLIDQGGTQATFTLNLPASPLDGQICTITYNNAITTLTIDGNGNTIVGSAVVTGVPGSQRKFKFYTGIGWMKIY